MKLTVDVKGLREVQEAMRDFSERRVKAAMATALTRTAVKVRAEVRRELPSVFDRPSAYTMRNIRYTGATAKSLMAVVGFDIDAVSNERGQVQRYVQTGNDTPASKYLQFQVDGGARRLKRYELALQAKGAMPKGWVSVPGAGARLDAYGNVSRGQIAQIISQLGTELLSGYTNTPQSLKAKVAAQRKAGGQFIAVLPGRGGKLKPGVYQRERIGRNLTPVLIYVKAATYKPRFDFDGITRRAAERILPDEISQAVRESAAGLTARGAT